MKNYLYTLKFVLAIVVSFTLLTACSKVKEMADKEKEKTEKTDKKEETKKEDTKKETSSKEETSSNKQLYFCEDYKNGKEIGVSDRFTTGWLTVMVETGKDHPLGVGKVELRLTKIKDEDGNKISEKIIDTVPFDVQADWHYTYFQDKKRLKFSSPGTYRVTLQKVDGTPICSGEVEVTSK